MLATRVEEWKRQLIREGAMNVICDLLEYRFDALPDWVRERLAAAEVADLRRWACQLLDAKSLDEVFH